MADDDKVLRARLNEELGFYPASLDEASIAEYRRRASANDDTPPTGWIGTKSEVNEQEEIEKRKKKAERGWLVEPPVPYPDYSPVEEIEKWYAVIGVRGRELP